SNKFVQRGSTRRAIQLEHGFRWECLTPGTDPDVEFMETIIAVGGGRPDSEKKSHNALSTELSCRGGSGSRTRSIPIFWSHATQFGLNQTYLTACGTQVTSRYTQFGLSEVDLFSCCWNLRTIIAVVGRGFFMVRRYCSKLDAPSVEAVVSTTA